MNTASVAGADGAAFTYDHAGEPTLDDILADPLVGLILRRDRLTAGAVRAALDHERRRLATRGTALALPRAA